MPHTVSARVSASSNITYTPCLRGMLLHSLASTHHMRSESEKRDVCHGPLSQPVLQGWGKNRKLKTYSYRTQDVSQLGKLLLRSFTQKILMFVIQHPFRHTLRHGFLSTGMFLRPIVIRAQSNTRSSLSFCIKWSRLS
jgi:hypothetical protein